MGFFFRATKKTTKNGTIRHDERTKKNGTTKGSDLPKAKEKESIKKKENSGVFSIRELKNSPSPLYFLLVETKKKEAFFRRRFFFLSRLIFFFICFLVILIFLETQSKYFFAYFFASFFLSRVHFVYTAFAFVFSNSCIASLLLHCRSKELLSASSVGFAVFVFASKKFFFCFSNFCESHVFRRAATNGRRYVSVLART
jgi:hypothetical protein